MQSEQHITSVTDQEFEEWLQIEIVKDIYHVSKDTLLPRFSILFTQLFFFYNSNPVILAGWAALFITIWFIARSNVIKFYKAKHIDASYWNRNTKIASTFFPIIIGIPALLFLDISNIPTVITFTVLMAIVPILSINLTASHLYTSNMWTLCILVPLSFFYIFKAGGDWAIFGYVILFCAIPVFLFINNKLHRSFVDTKRLEFDKEQLLLELKAKHEELTLQKEMAEKANVDKSRFLAATSHDLRQPLFAMRLFLDDLQDAVPSKHKALVEKVISSHAALTELLNALLNISALDSGGIKPEIKSFQLSHVLNNLANEWLPQIAEKGFELRIRPSDKWIHSDPILLTQLLRNFLSNSLAHCTSGDVLFGCRKKGQHIYIGVWDQGPGIPESEMKKIFDKFYQLNNPERDRDKGIGLGLSTVKLLAKILGHELVVKSELGRGSFFGVKVPLASGKQVEQVVSPPHPEGQIGLLDIFVVVIEDQKDIREGLRRTLHRWGCETLIANSEPSALNELKRDSYEAPDIIIADYRLMKEKTGVQAVQALRNYFNDKDIPAIIISGDTNKEVSDTAQNTQCAFLTKPVEPDKLYHQLIKLADIKNKTIS